MDEVQLQVKGFMGGEGGLQRWQEVTVQTLYKTLQILFDSDQGWQKSKDETVRWKDREEMVGIMELRQKEKHPDRK